MTAMDPRRLLIAALLMATQASTQAADEPAKAQGDLWQVTSKISMPGMPMEMPAQTTQTCAPKEWTRPPSNPNDRMQCRDTNFQKLGTKLTWETHCKGPPAMSGVGEITFQGADAYSGTITYSGGEGGMTIELKGHRKGTCDNPG